MSDSETNARNLIDLVEDFDFFSRRSENSVDRGVLVEAFSVLLILRWLGAHLKIQNIFGANFLKKSWDNLPLGNIEPDQSVKSWVGLASDVCSESPDEIHGLDMKPIQEALSRMSLLPTDVSLAMLNKVSGIDPSQMDGIVSGQIVLDEILKWVIKGDAEAANLYSTNKNIAAEMVRMADPKSGEDVYDPCFGVGEILTTAMAHSSGEKIHGREVDPSRYIVGIARILYSGGVRPVLQFGDSLKYGNTSESKGSQYDCIIANPPSIINSKGKFDDSLINTFTHPFAESDCLLFIQHVLGSLRPDGRAVILLPSSFLNMPKRKVMRFREWLVNNYNVRNINLIHYNLCLLEIHNSAPDPFITWINGWESEVTEYKLFELSRKEDDSSDVSGIVRLDSDVTNKSLLSLPITERSGNQVMVDELASTRWNLFPKSKMTHNLERWWHLPKEPGDNLYPFERLTFLWKSFRVTKGVRLKKDDVCNKHGVNEENVFVLRADDIPRFSTTSHQLNLPYSGQMFIKNFNYALTRLGAERLREKYIHLDLRFLSEGDIIFSFSRGEFHLLMVPKLPDSTKCIVAGSDVNILRRKRKAEISSADLYTLMSVDYFRLWAISMKSHPHRGHLINELNRLKVPVREKHDDNEDVFVSDYTSNKKEELIDRVCMSAPDSELEDEDDFNETIDDSEFFQWVLDLEYGGSLAELSGSNSMLGLFSLANEINSVTKAESNLTNPILIGLEQMIFGKWIDDLRYLADWIISLEGKDYSDDYYESVKSLLEKSNTLNCGDRPFNYEMIPAKYRSYINSDHFEMLNDSARCLGSEICSVLEREIYNHHEEQNFSVSHADGIVFLDDESIELTVTNQGPLSLNNLVIGGVSFFGLKSGESCTFRLPLDEKIRSIVNEKSAYSVVEIPLRIQWVSWDDYGGEVESTAVFEVGVSRKDEYPDIGELPENAGEAVKTAMICEVLQRASMYPYSAEARNLTRNEKNLYQSDDIEPVGMGSMKKRFEKREAWLESISNQVEEKKSSNFAAPATGGHDFGSNPYVAGPAIQNKEKLFGRSKIIESIKDILPPDSESNVILLEGNRRSGKTSILNYLRDPEVLSGWIACYSSLQEAEGSNRGAGIETSEVFRSLAQDVGVVLLKRGIEFQVRGYQSSDFDFEDKEKINGWIDYTREAFKSDYPKGVFEECLESFMEAAKPRGILLMLDEFDKLQEGIDNGITSPQVPENFRALIHKFSRFNAILSGSRRIKRLRDEYWSALFGLGHRIGVTAIDEKDARDLITITSNGKLNFTENSISEILKVTACQPFLVQSLCKDIFLEAKYQKNHRISLDFTKEIIADKAIENEHFSSLWEYAETNRRRLILHLALKCQQEKSYLTINEIEKGLNQYGVTYEIGEKLEDDIAFLLEMEMLKFVNQQSQQYYVFEVPFFAMWIENNKNLDLLVRDLETE